VPRLQSGGYPQWGVEYAFRVSPRWTPGSLPTFNVRMNPTIRTVLLGGFELC
jgi:hypothetical protein